MTMLLQLIALSIISLVRVSTKEILILGESGNGKSSLIKHGFKVTEQVPIGHSKHSETKSVYAYHTPDTPGLFKGFTIYDTPGFEDTAGFSNDEIVQLIEAELSQIDSNEAVIDGMVLMVGTWHVRDHTTLHLTDYMQLFGEDMLPSLSVVVALWDCDVNLKKATRDGASMRDHLQTELSALVAKSTKYRDTGLKVPIIYVDSKNPDDEELETLKNTLSKRKPYKLGNLQNRKIRIEELFALEMTNQSNYKNHSENIIDYEMQMVKTQAVKRTSVQREETKCGGPEWSFNVGFFRLSGSLKCKTVKKWVPEDVIVDLEKEEKVPITKQNVTQILKNEVEYYWDVAKQKYKQELLAQFLNRKKK
eukprot:450428_1